MNSKPRVRFAPSPTGEVHIGNARTALFNYLYAAATGGELVLRIEDTDVARSTREHAESLMAALRWLGVRWDEGPDCGGPCGPYRQSERLELYREHAQRLVEEGKAYPCYCQEEELEAYRKAMLRQGIPPRYSGKCRHLSAQQRSALEAAGRRPSLRYRVPDEGTVRFEDRIHGRMTFRLAEVGDFVILRQTGMPSYSFAVVVDDHHMGVTTVIRGEDHLANTPRQILLYREFGWTEPEFAHHALLLGPDRRKLSKRHGVTSVAAFRETGILPEALGNYLALLGGNPLGEQEIFTYDEVIPHFSLEKAGRSSSVFDIDKLLWINAHHLRRAEPQRLAEAMRPFLEDAGFETAGRDPEWLGEVARVIAENVRSLRDVSEYAPIFFNATVPFEDEVAQELRNTEHRRALEVFLERYRAEPVTDAKRVAPLVKGLCKELGLKPKQVYWPLRLALTGMHHGPELDRVFALVPAETVVRRLEAALNDSGAPSV